MDTQYLMQAAGEAGGEMLEPVSNWGGRMSTGALVFFGSDSTAGVEVKDASRYFLETMQLQDPQNLKMGICHVYSICRGNILLYEALATPECMSHLYDLVKYRDTQIADKAASLLSGVFCRFPGKCTVDQVKSVTEYNGSEAGKLDVLANLLKHDEWRVVLFPPASMRVLSGVASSSVPVMYKGLMCVWLASFSKECLAKIPASVIVSINEVLKSSRTEKVVRIALMAIENLLKSKAMCEELAEQETLALVTALENEKWRDSELIALIAALIGKLQEQVKVLTNFERFEREVTSGRLKWGFIHSEKFWLENVLKCEANNFRIIDHLMVIARTSRDPETLAVACHDLGEFARLHPVGKQIATNRGAKDKMLELMSSAQREVAREALLCVQKLMLMKQADLASITGM